MLSASVLYFGFILLVTGGGIALTRVGTNSGHILASAAGAFGCILAAALAAIVMSVASGLGTV